MAKWFLVPLSVFLVFTIGSYPVLAESSYVLPYPSFMPGSGIYKIHLLWEELMNYWYFGNFGKFTYNLKQSDKYLVEAKTLLEYKQYLLGYKALKRSNDYFTKVNPYLNKARIENKNISQRQNILKEAALKHIEVLKKTKQDVPEAFVWQPERLPSTTLNLKKSIEESIVIRNITEFF